ncbi:MAG: phosphotransferase [Pseudomonadales bacterium]|nr:homoserine kinase [Pseudomonadales bacterium]NIX08712.1 phosphotransferase [Pseudomonadales bacterium]
MNAITDPGQTGIEETLARYGVGELISAWPGSPATTCAYEIRTQRAGKEHDYLFLRVPASGFEAELAALEACDRAGLPVAKAIPNLAGQPLDRLNGETVMLTRRIPGRRVYNPTVRQVAALGRFMARFHDAGGNLGPLPAFACDEKWLVKASASVDGRLSYSSAKLLGSSVAQVVSMLGREDVANLPSGAIHGDICRDNVLFNEHGLSGVAGFGQVASGFLVYDLAVAANDWCNDAGGILDPERTLGFLRAYQEIRPLVRAELWFFSGFTLYAALTCWINRLAFTQDQQVTPGAHFNTPLELERIVEQHSAHFFYLDERLLT